MIRAAFLVLLVATPVVAQTPVTTKKPPATRSAPPRVAGKSTLSGVYTLEEAGAGKELYVALCATCHTSSNRHTGPEFRKKWSGQPLSELYVYIRDLMPKNDPGSLAAEDYGVILAYMLQMNRMPTGKAYLSTDPKELAKIRFDTARAVRKP